MNTRQQIQPSALRFYWYEIKPSEALGSMWGQFVGAMHRLVDISEELSEVSKQRDVLRRLHSATRLIESYLHRAYELRERAVKLLGAITGRTKLASSAKKPAERSKAMNTLRARHSDLVDAISRLLILLDDDMLLRNMHTHEQFLSLGLWAPNGPYDPDDVLVELEHRPDEYRKMIAFLRIEIRKLVGQYRKRIRSIVDAAEVFAAVSKPAPKSAGIGDEDPMSTS